MMELMSGRQLRLTNVLNDTMLAWRAELADLSVKKKAAMVCVREACRRIWRYDPDLDVFYWSTANQFSFCLSADDFQSFTGRANRVPTVEEALAVLTGNHRPRNHPIRVPTAPGEPVRA
jgi:hypothetical protein